MTVADTASPPEHRIAPRGELCVDTIDGLRRVLTDAAARGGTVVIDLAEVTILSAAAVGLLAVTHAALRSEGGGVRLTNPSSLTHQVLAAVGLEDLLVQ